MAPCTICEKRVINRSKGLECYICEEWTHITCCNVRTSLYDELVPYEGPNLLFVCDQCKPDVVKLRQVRRNLPSGSSGESSSVDDPVVTCIFKDEAAAPVQENLTEPLPVSSTPKKRKRPKKSLRKNRAAATTTPAVIENAQSAPLATSSIVQSNETVKPGVPVQFNDVKPMVSKFPPREQCLIVVNIPESSSQVSQQRLDDDLRQLRSCFSSLFMVGEEEIAASIRVKAAYRLGKPKTPATDELTCSPRPLKVVLSTHEEAKAVLQRKHRLRGSCIRILKDLSPEDRSKLRDALAELKKRRDNGETDLFVRDFRVVKRRPKVRWEPLFLKMKHPNAEENPPQRLD